MSIRKLKSEWEQILKRLGIETMNSSMICVELDALSADLTRLMRTISVVEAQVERIKEKICYLSVGNITERSTQSGKKRSSGDMD